MNIFFFEFFSIDRNLKDYIIILVFVISSIYHIIFIENKAKENSVCFKDLLNHKKGFKEATLCVLMIITTALVSIMIMVVIYVNQWFPDWIMNWLSQTKQN